MGAGVESIRFESKGWPQWWDELESWRRVAPVALIGAYWALLLALGVARPEHGWVGVAMLALAYGGRRARETFRFFLPLYLTGIIYDSMRWIPESFRARVRVAEPYWIELRFFGVQVDEGVLTLNEWWQQNTHPFLDFFTGLAYLVFIPVFVLNAAWFRYLGKRKGTSRRDPQWLRSRALAVMDSFFWVNLMGYSTYYWYPAAPPWYVALRGLGPADLSEPPNPAGAARFDELLGTSFFTEWYGRSADVFGAIPSLHVAYPLLTVLFAFRFGALRWSSLAFYFLMCFSAVYLNHHYLIDVIWGSAYSVLVFVGVNAYYERKIRRTSRITTRPEATKRLSCA